MTLFPLPALLTVPPFDPGPESDSYSKIFADTMGNLATPDDGFDQALASAADFTTAGMLSLQPGDTDILNAAHVASTFDTGDESQISVDLQGASDALDAALNDYATAIPPTVNPGGTTVSNGTQPPAPAGCAATSISSPSDGCIGKVAPGSAQPSLNFAATEAGLWEASITDQDTLPSFPLSAPFVPGFFNPSNVTAAQILSVSGQGMTASLTPFPDGVTSVVPAYVKILFNPAFASRWDFIMAVQIDGAAAWHNVHVLVVV